MIYSSKFTPNIQPKEVLFGYEEVTYKRTNGVIEKATIVSTKMKHTSGVIGYEGIFPDGERAFLSEDSIINWEGKTTKT